MWIRFRFLPSTSKTNYENFWFKLFCDLFMACYLWTDVNVVPTGTEVIRKKNNNNFFAILKATDVQSRTRIRIRIQIGFLIGLKMWRIRNTASGHGFMKTYCTFSSGKHSCPRWKNSSWQTTSNKALVKLHSFYNQLTCCHKITTFSMWFLPHRLMKIS